MHEVTQIRAFTSLLALLIGLASLPSLALADDDNDKKNKDSKSETKNESYQPDLKIEFLGFYSPENTQLVKFKVTNIGRERSTATVALGETLRPEPKNVQGMEVPALDPGKSKEILYPLAAPCDGHEVKATVTIPDDVNLENNTDQATACDEKSKPSGNPSTQTGGVVLGPKTDDILKAPSEDLARTAPGSLDNVLLPEYLQSGPHTDFQVPLSRSKTIGRRKTTGICPADPPTVTELRVGFTRNDAEGLCQFNTVYQTALSFDLTKLSEAYHRPGLIDKAVLTWRDQPYESGFEERLTGGALSCVMYLGAPTVDWIDQPIDDLIPNDYVDGGYVRTSTWEIPDLLRTWLAQPIAASRGVLLRGFDESFDDGENDDADCFSRISDVKLIVNYTVLK